MKNSKGSIVAVAIWRERIAPVFDSARQIRVIQFSAEEALETLDRSLDECGYHEKVSALLRLGVQELLCGAISNEFRLMIEGAGIVVHSFLAGSVIEVLEAWRNGNLDDSRFAMPGCCCRQRRRVRRYCFRGERE